MSKRIPATAQGIFNKVAKHLLTQNRRSVGKSECGATQCLMLDPKGNRCAIGCLLTKKQAIVFNDCHLYGFTFIPEIKKNLHLLENLQRVHDHRQPCRWPGALRKLAKQMNLKVPTFLENA